MVNVFNELLFILPFILGVYHKTLSRLTRDLFQYFVCKIFGNVKFCLDLTTI